MTEINLQSEASLSTILTDENAIIKIKSELKKVVEFSKPLEIKDYGDESQFRIVKEAKNGYVKTRNTIKRAFKEKRDEYTVLAKDNLEAEREVVGVIQQEEERLSEMVKEANRLKLVKENELKLQSRKDQLREYERELTDNELLEMKDQEFFKKLSEAKEIYLEEKEKRLAAEKERLERDKEIKEAARAAKKEAEEKAKRDVEEEKIKAKREAEAAKKKADEEKLKAVEKAKREAEADKQKLIKEQEEKEKERKAKEEKEKQETRAREEEEEKEKNKIEKRKKYQKWLSDNRYNKEDCLLQREGVKIVMYKKTSGFKI